MHTMKGKQKKRSCDHFINESSKLENQKDILDEYKEHFETYLIDYQNKKVDGTGYDSRNVVHKSPKDMEQWKRENSQTKMFE